MPVSLTCPSGHRLTVSRRYAGKLVRCPKCGQKTRIPSLATIERKLREQQESENTAGGSTPPLAEDEPTFEASAERPPPASLEAPPIVAPAHLRVEAPPIELPSMDFPPSPNAAPSAQTSPRAEPPPAPSATESTTSTVPEAPAAESPAEAPVRGYRPEPERRWTCLGLGVALAVIGVFGAVPSVLEIAEYARSDGTVPVARWAWLALLAAAVQIAYAVYAAQLPDWSTAWVVTLVGAALATFYAFLLALTLVAGESSSIVAVLQLSDHVPQGRATRWCFAMLGILGVYAYFAGRSALGWRHAFRLTRPMKESKAALSSPPRDQTI
jgi:hypothetical protein